MLHALLRKLFPFACSVASFLFLSCTTTQILFTPKSAEPQSRTVLVKSINSHYIQDDVLALSAGLKPYGYETLGLFLYIENKSDKVFRVDPLLMQCYGMGSNGKEEALSVVAPGDPDRQNETLLLLGAIAAGASSNPYMYQQSVAEQEEFNRSLLRRNDVLPGQQIEGIVLIRLKYNVVEKELSRGRIAERIEEIFDLYRIEIELGDKRYILTFTRETI